MNKRLAIVLSKVAKENNKCQKACMIASLGLPKIIEQNLMSQFVYNAIDNKLYKMR